MATTLRQMMKDVGVNDLSSANMVIQKGVGPWPMPGVIRTDTVSALGGTGGVAITSTDPALDKRITSAFDMPRAFIQIGGTVVYWPVCLSNQDPRLVPIYTQANQVLQSVGNNPIHIITDLQVEPWKGYQGRTAGYLNATSPP